MPRLLASVTWNVTTGLPSVVTLVMAPFGASWDHWSAVNVAASIGVPVGAGTVTDAPGGCTGGGGVDGPLPVSGLPPPPPPPHPLIAMARTAAIPSFNQRPI